MRARDLGITIGDLSAGALNAITDVPGVKVGHRTLIEGDGALRVGEGPVRTGVTVVLPHDRDLGAARVRRLASAQRERRAHRPGVGARIGNAHHSDRADEHPQRAGLGVARTGGAGESNSGDLFLAFATGNTGLRAEAVGRDAPLSISLDMVANERMSPMFDAVIEATEEAIVNALLAAETMTGRDGVVAHRLPAERLVQIVGWSLQRIARCSCGCVVTARSGAQCGRADGVNMPTAHNSRKPATNSAANRACRFMSRSDLVRASPTGSHRVRQ